MRQAGALPGQSGPGMHRGRGTEGQLGLHDYRPRTVPALVKTLGEQSKGTSVLQVRQVGILGG